MQILVNTDNHITGREELAAQVESIVQDALGRFSKQITRIEVHLGDANSRKGGDDDKRCMMEARLEGHQPTAVTHHAGDLMMAVDGAADKMKAALDHLLGRLRDHR
jgi:ribosome-associated translation inhibitor RaiA